LRGSKNENASVSKAPIDNKKHVTRQTASPPAAPTGSDAPGRTCFSMRSVPALATIALVAGLLAACINQPQRAAPTATARPRPTPAPATQLECSFKSEDGNDLEYHTYRLTGSTLLETSGGVAKAGTSRARARFKIQSDDGERIVATRTVHGASGEAGSRAAGSTVLTIDLRHHEATLKSTASADGGERTLTGACAQAG
jgi:hypothetical protein